MLYAVEFEAGPAAVKSAVQNLADSAVRAIVVVDQCATDTHRDLAAIVKRSSSRLSLVTIDPELPAGNLPSDTLLPRPGGRQSGRSDPEAGRTQSAKRRSTPPPKIRVRLSQDGASSRARPGVRDSSIATVSDDELVERVLVGRSLADRQSLLDAGMLLGTFRPAWDEITASRYRACRPAGAEQDGRRSCAPHSEICRREVWPKRRGRLLALQPRPVALRLAERQWQQWSDKRSGRDTDRQPPETSADQSGRPIGFAQRPADRDGRGDKYVCRLNGPFASLDALAADGNAEILSSLAEIDAEAVVTLIDRLIDPLSIDECKQIDGDLRRHLVWALEKIAFLETTFEQGARLLFKLALAENESWGNNATGEFKAIFPALLGNTAADGKTRLRLLDELIEKNDRRGNAPCRGGASQGRDHAQLFSRRRPRNPWQPAGACALAAENVEGCLRLHHRLLRAAGRARQARRRRLGRRRGRAWDQDLRLLVSRGFIDKVEKWAADISAAHRYWPEAIDGLANVLQYDKNGLEPGVAERVQKLIDRLMPDDLRGRAKFLLTDMPWDYLVDETHDFEAGRKRQRDAVEQLTADLLKEPKVITELLPQLSTGEHRMVYEFGRDLAKQAAKPLDWLVPLQEAFVADAPGGQETTACSSAT